MLEHLILAAFLQLSVPATAVVEQAAPEPERVCKMEPVTGSRVRKQKVCKLKGGFDPDAEKAQDLLRRFERGGSIVQPSLPPGVG